MRKIVLLLVFAVMLLTLPVNVRAASDVTLENLTIQLWPDHDELAVLVIYDFNLTANTPLPATAHFQIPPNANLTAVAKNSGGALVDVAHELSAAQDNSQIVTFTIDEQTGYHLEYYLPYTLEGTVRNFVFTWPGDYAVKSFNLALQKPSAATNITTAPLLADIPQDQNGFEYQATSILKLAAGQTYSLKVRYDNESDILSASTLSVQPSAPLTGNLPGQVSVMTYIPWVLAGLALLLIAGGIGWYWLSSRGSTSSPKRARHVSARDKTATDATPDRQVYCHQCGKRAQPDDRFCRTCGAALRQGEA